MKKKYKINLLLKKKSNLEKDIIYFLLHYFRYILVITQIVIIIVFFYRLKVDQEIVDLNDTLRQQKEILTVLQPFIADAQQKHILIKDIKSILLYQKDIDSIFNYILSIFPADFYLDKFNLDKDKILLTGKSLDYITIMRFYNRLRKDKRFSKINLQSIQKTGNFFNFEIELSGFKLKKNL